MNEKNFAHKYANEVAEECLAQRLQAVGRIVSNRDGIELTVDGGLALV